MRKLAIFFIIVFVIVFALVVAAHFSPPLKDALGGFALTVGGSVWVAATGAWQGLADVVSTTGLNFLIYTLAVLIFGWATAAMLHSLWQKHAPKVLGGQKPTIVNYGGSFNPQTAPATPETAPKTASAIQEPEQKEQVAG